MGGFRPGQGKSGSRYSGTLDLVSGPSVRRWRWSLGSGFAAGSEGYGRLARLRPFGGGFAPSLRGNRGRVPGTGGSLDLPWGLPRPGRSRIRNVASGSSVDRKRRPSPKSGSPNPLGPVDWFGHAGEASLHPGSAPAAKGLDDKFATIRRRGRGSARGRQVAGRPSRIARCDIGARGPVKLPVPSSVRSRPRLQRRRDVLLQGTAQRASSPCTRRLFLYHPRFVPIN